MITVNQSVTVPVTELNSLLMRYGRATFEVDTELLAQDVDKLESLRGSITKDNANVNESIRRTIKYLKNLNKQLFDAGGHGDVPRLSIGLEVERTKQGIRAVSNPISFEKIAEFGIQTTDYIVLKETMLEVNFVEALNLMAFELCSNDSGYSWNDTERMMAKYGIIQTHQASGLDFVKSNEFRADMGLRIEDSDYQLDASDMGDYFGNSVGHCKVYREALMSTGYMTGLLVMNNLLHNLHKLGITGVRVAAQYEDSIILVVNDRQVQTVKDVASESLAVTMKGRRFEVATHVIG